MGLAISWGELWDREILGSSDSCGNLQITAIKVELITPPKEDYGLLLGVCLFLRHDVSFRISRRVSFAMKVSFRYSMADFILGQQKSSGFLEILLAMMEVSRNFGFNTGKSSAVGIPPKKCQNRDSSSCFFFKIDSWPSEFWNFRSFTENLC